MGMKMQPGIAALLLLALLTTQVRSQTSGDNSSLPSQTTPTLTTVPSCEVDTGCCLCTGNITENCQQECREKWFKDLVVWILPAGVAFIVLLTVVILLVACHCRRKRKIKKREMMRSERCQSDLKHEQATEAKEGEDDTYLIVLPDEVQNSTPDLQTPSTDLIYVNVPSPDTCNGSPRLPPKSPETGAHKSATTPSDAEEEEPTEYDYPGTASIQGIKCFLNSLQYDLDKDENIYDELDPVFDFTSPEVMLGASPPGKYKGKSPANIQVPPASPRGRAPAQPSPGQDIYSPVYEQRNTEKYGVKFAGKHDSSASHCRANLGHSKQEKAPSPVSSPVGVYGNVEYHKKRAASGSVSPEDTAAHGRHLAIPTNNLGYLPMNGARDHTPEAESDEIYVNHSVTSH